MKIWSLFGHTLKRIYTTKNTLGKTIAREDGLVKQADPIPKVQAKSRVHKSQKRILYEDIPLNIVFLYIPIVDLRNLEHLSLILSKLHLYQLV